MRISGIGLSAAGVLLNNYAYLHGASAEGVVVLGSMRFILAAAGVALTAAGLLMLLRWAQSQGGPRQRPV